MSTSSDEGDESEICQTCGDWRYGKEMLLCDDCDLGFHTFCLRPKLHEIPAGDWFCPFCVLKRESAKSVVPVAVPRISDTDKAPLQNGDTAAVANSAALCEADRTETINDETTEERTGAGDPDQVITTSEEGTDDTMLDLQEEMQRLEDALREIPDVDIGVVSPGTPPPSSFVQGDTCSVAVLTLDPVTATPTSSLCYMYDEHVMDRPITLAPVAVRPRTRPLKDDPSSVLDSVLNLWSKPSIVQSFAVDDETNIKRFLAKCAANEKLDLAKTTLQPNGLSSLVEGMAVNNDTFLALHLALVQDEVTGQWTVVNATEHDEYGIGRKIPLQLGIHFKRGMAGMAATEHLLSLSGNKTMVQAEEEEEEDNQDGTNGPNATSHQESSPVDGAVQIKTESMPYNMISADGEPLEEGEVVLPQLSKESRAADMTFEADDARITKTSPIKIFREALEEGEVFVGRALFIGISPSGEPLKEGEVVLLDSEDLHVEQSRDEEGGSCAEIPKASLIAEAEAVLEEGEVVMTKEEGGSRAEIPKASLIAEEEAVLEEGEVVMTIHKASLITEEEAVLEEGEVVMTKEEGGTVVCSIGAETLSADEVVTGEPADYHLLPTVDSASSVIVVETELPADMSPVDEVNSNGAALPIGIVGDDLLVVNHKQVASTVDEPSQATVDDVVAAEEDPRRVLPALFLSCRSSSSLSCSTDGPGEDVTSSLDDCKGTSSPPQPSLVSDSVAFASANHPTPLLVPVIDHNGAVLSVELPSNGLIVEGPCGDSQVPQAATTDSKDDPSDAAPAQLLGATVKLEKPTIDPSMIAFASIAAWNDPSTKLPEDDDDDDVSDGRREQDDDASSSIDGETSQDEDGDSSSKPLLLFFEQIPDSTGRCSAPNIRPPVHVVKRPKCDDHGAATVARSALIPHQSLEDQVLGCLNRVIFSVVGAVAKAAKKDASRRVSSSSSNRQLRRKRCGQCEGCLVKDICGECIACKVKVKFGGDGKTRRGCFKRQCTNLLRPDGSPCTPKQLNRGSRGKVSLDDNEGATTPKTPLRKKARTAEASMTMSPGTADGPAAVRRPRKQPNAAQTTGDGLALDGGGVDMRKKILVTNVRLDLFVPRWWWKSPEATDDVKSMLASVIFAVERQMSAFIKESNTRGVRRCPFRLSVTRDAFDFEPIPVVVHQQVQICGTAGDDAITITKQRIDWCVHISDCSKEMLMHKDKKLLPHESDPEMLRLGCSTYVDVLEADVLARVEDDAMKVFKDSRKDLQLRPETYHHSFTARSGKDAPDSSVTRTKMFFGARYLWTANQMSEPGARRAHGIRVDVNRPPPFATQVVLPAVMQCGAVPPGMVVNQVAMNIYHTGTCGIAPHFDDNARFELPVISLRVFSDSRLSFGCRGSWGTSQELAGGGEE